MDATAINTSNTVAQSGVPAATLSNATIENAAISGVAAAGTLSEAELTEVTMKSATINQAASPSSTIQEAPNITFLGDILEFHVPVPNFANRDNPIQIRNAEIGDCFLVSKDEPDILTGHFVNPFLLFGCNGRSIRQSDNKKGPLNEGQDGTFTIRKNILDGRDYDRIGFTYGVLAIPFKYDLKTSTLQQNGTLGGYLGWGEKRPGSTFSLATFFGATQGNAFTTQNNVTTTSIQNGYSGGIGLLAVIKDVVSVGFFFGSDVFQQDTRNWAGINLVIKSSN